MAESSLNDELCSGLQIWVIKSYPHIHVSEHCPFSALPCIKSQIKSFTPFTLPSYTTTNLSLSSVYDINLHRLEFNICQSHGRQFYTVQRRD